MTSTAATQAADALVAAADALRALAAVSTPATVVRTSPVVSSSKMLEPDTEFEIYDGDHLIFTYEGNDSPNAVTVRINSGVEVYVSPDEARSLIIYLQQCLASQGKNIVPF